MPTPTTILGLVERFDYHRDAYRSGQYKEAQLCREFLDPFFEALGWDVQNRQGYAEAYKDVIHEDAIKVGGATKAPDYCFRIGGMCKFFVEAKKPSVGLKDAIGPAFQLRRYAWSAKLPLSILGDFEEFAVYDCRVRPDKADKASAACVMYLTYADYPHKWDEIATVFSREAVLKGSFDRYAEANRAKKGTAEVDDAFLREIESWRDLLAHNLALRNPGLTPRQLNSAVQATIDRIVFLRICEDRGIEEYGQLMALLNGGQVYERMGRLFRRADERYNSGLFHFRAEEERSDPPDDLTLSLALDDKPLKDIVKGLYYPDSPYEFSVLPADILGQVYEQFLGKVIRLTPGHHAVVEDKPEVKKAGGAYYTPTYIVDYIVHNTLGRLLEGKTVKQIAQGRRPQGSPLRILDPACGSGSFLLGAYQYLLDWHRDWYVADGPEKWAKGRASRLFQASGGDWRLTTPERKRILLDHIYGVDIDPQAVEVTKLSLLLKVLEGENEQTLTRQLALFHERALPDLGRNVKCGNSLIGPDFYEGRQTSFLDEEERYRVNAFDWETEFPEVFGSYPSPKGRGARGEDSDEGAPHKPPLPPEILRRCRELRQNATDAEHLLWRLLRNRQLGGAKFRRQHPLGRYILDLYCHEAKLAIELDGGGHAQPEQKKHDAERTRELEAQGVHLLRFWNNEVLQQTQAVLETIWDALMALTPTLSSLTPTLSQRERETSPSMKRETSPSMKRKPLPSPSGGGAGSEGEGGFDVVIGNPPYIQLSMADYYDKEVNSYLTQHYSSSMGRLNTFGLFIERVLRTLLAEDGFLSFIVPNTILTQEYYQPLRQEVLRNRLDTITTYRYPVFVNAVVETVVFVIQNAAPNSNKVQVVDCDNRLMAYQSREIQQESYLTSHRNAFLVKVDEKTIGLKAKLDRAGQPLKSIANINQAIALKYDRSQSLFRERKGDNYKPVLDGRNIQRYALTWDGYYLAYDVDRIHSCKRTDIFEAEEKIFFRRVGDRLIATYDNAQFYALNTLVVVTLLPQVGVTLKYVLGLLNSRLLNLYYTTYLKSTKKVFSEIQARQIAQLPIHPISFSDPADKPRHDRMVALVERMLALHRELAAARTAHEKTTLQRQIEATDRQIDVLVYELYGLTEEEIKIVEERRS